MAAYITLVTIRQNYWAKLSLIVVSSVATFFLFDYLMTVKLEENLKKFYQLDKYEKNIQITLADGKNIDEKLQSNYDEAKDHFDKSLPFLNDYKTKGNKKVVSKIMTAVNLKDVEIRKQTEIVKKFMRYESVKKEVFFDGTNKEKLAKLDAKLDSLKIDFNNHSTLGDSVTAINIAKKLNFGEVETKKFFAAYKIDVAKSLSKNLDEADNRLLNYSMMVFFSIFALVYFIVEKLRRPTASKMSNMFKKLQLLSSAAFSLGHGGSDAQKVMGIIGAALIANGNIVDFKEIPTWVPLACYGAIGLGTLSGGWKIVKTMGSKITKVTPLEGVGAETAGAITLFMTAQMGIPVSTTHTITGSIIGVGATKRLSAVRWGVTRSLMFAWIITIPISAIVAALSYWIISAF
jgi:phosphate/sulfate permease